MDEEDIIELYELIKNGYNNTDWILIEESLEFISEFIDIDDEDI
jgi:hypothetical protein